MTLYSIHISATNHTGSYVEYIQTCANKFTAAAVCMTVNESDCRHFFERVDDRACLDDTKYHVWAEEEDAETWTQLFYRELSDDFDGEVDGNSADVAADADLPAGTEVERDDAVRNDEAEAVEHDVDPKGVAVDLGDSVERTEV